MALLEQASVRIGITRLTDCVTIAAAQELGEFKKEGLDVTISRHDSWAAVRDQLAYDGIDAAHLLSPMVVASAAGLGPFPGVFTTSLAINLNGNAITASNALFSELEEVSQGETPARPMSASAIARVVELRKRRGAGQLTLAVVYPFSMHNYELRYWLAEAGVHPDRDVRIVVAPPSRMVEALESGAVDGYCVGEPWNSEAIHAGIGRTLITSSEIWSNGPEKVLGVRKDWAGRNPETHRALIRALLRASRWVDAAENRVAAAEMIASSSYVDLPPERIAGALTGLARQTAGGLTVDIPDFNVFHRYAANFPWRSHAMWIAAQMARWGQAAPDIDIAAAARSAFDPVPYRAAASEVGVAAPLIDLKVEGAHAQPWTLTQATAPIEMGADRLMDKVAFDPNNIEAYFAGLTMHSMRRLHATAG